MYITRATLLAVAAFVVLIALALGGIDDLAEAERQQAEYCANVHSKIWPDYKKTYRAYCKDGKVRPTSSSAP